MSSLAGSRGSSWLCTRPVKVSAPMKPVCSGSSCWGRGGGHRPRLEVGRPRGRASGGAGSQLPGPGLRTRGSWAPPPPLLGLPTSFPPCASSGRAGSLPPLRPRPRPPSPGASGRGAGARGRQGAGAWPPGGAPRPPRTCSWISCSSELLSIEPGGAGPGSAAAGRGCSADDSAPPRPARSARSAGARHGATAARPRELAAAAGLPPRAAGTRPGTARSSPTVWG